jgi:hypothetical protein
MWFNLFEGQLIRWNLSDYSLMFEGVAAAGQSNVRLVVDETASPGAVRALNITGTLDFDHLNLSLRISRDEAGYLFLMKNTELASTMTDEDDLYAYYTVTLTELGLVEVRARELQSTVEPVPEDVPEPLVPDAPAPTRPEPAPPQDAPPGPPQVSMHKSPTWFYSLPFIVLMGGIAFAIWRMEPRAARPTYRKRRREPVFTEKQLILQRNLDLVRTFHFSKKDPINISYEIGKALHRGVPKEEIKVILEAIGLPDFAWEELRRLYEFL